MFRITYILPLILSLSGCALLEGVSSELGLSPSCKEKSAEIQEIFDSKQSESESDALAGRYTWVKREILMREFDKHIASLPEARCAWKYDSDDEEFHAYAVALAERLDKREITYAQFNAARTQRYNQIQARRKQLNLQQQAVRNSQPRTTTCTSQNLGTAQFPQWKTVCD
jgi:hypothetical protein